LPNIHLTGGAAASMPDLRGLSAREALRTLGEIGLSARVTGSGFVMRQSPEPGAAIDPGSWAGLDLQRTPHAGDPVESPR
jgi:beta-lactam-binding protein with PASTA domain